MTEDKRDLWQEYLYYTRELKKFLIAEDLDMFQILLQERERLQEFICCPPEKEIYDEVDELNREMTMLLSQKKNKLERQNQVSQAYDGYSQNQLGHWMDN